MILWDLLDQVNSDLFSEINHLRSFPGRNCLILFWTLGNNLCCGRMYQSKANRQRIRKTDIIWQVNIRRQQQAYLRDHAFTQHKYPGAHSAGCHTRIWEHRVSLPGACTPLGSFKKYAEPGSGMGWIAWEWAKDISTPDIYSCESQLFGCVSLGVWS